MVPVWEYTDASRRQQEDEGWHRLSPEDNEHITEVFKKWKGDRDYKDPPDAKIAVDFDRMLLRREVGTREEHTAMIAQFYDLSEQRHRWWSMRRVNQAWDLFDPEYSQLLEDLYNKFIGSSVDGNSKNEQDIKLKTVDCTWSTAKGREAKAEDHIVSFVRFSLRTAPAAPHANAYDLRRYMARPGSAKRRRSLAFKIDELKVKVDASEAFVKLCVWSAVASCSVALCCSGFAMYAFCFLRNGAAEGHPNDVPSGQPDAEKRETEMRLLGDVLQDMGMEHPEGTSDRNFA